MSGYKWQPNDAVYEPCSPYQSKARFGDGNVKTVYVAETDRGAMAEFFRRAPELIDFQDDLNIVLFELDLEVIGGCLDVRQARGQNEVGISEERLTSSDVDESARYAECRELGTEAFADGDAGI